MEIVYIGRAACRHTDASERNPQMSARSRTAHFDIQLKELVEDGLVAKTIYPELPPRSEYNITELGKTLLPIIDAMLQWGEEHFDIFEKKYGNK